jgi:pimeloyl-ACP methyl ester carboxylesterase
MSLITNTEPGIRIPETSSGFLDSTGSGDQRQGRLRSLTGGSGPPLVLLHTVRTQAEHVRHLIPLVQRYTVYALDLPGMGYSQIVPGASYDEPAMRAAVKRLITQLDLRDVTLLGESMGAVLVSAADLPDRIRRVVGGPPRRSDTPARHVGTGKSQRLAHDTKTRHTNSE